MLMQVLRAADRKQETSDQSSWKTLKTSIRMKDTTIIPMKALEDCTLRKLGSK